MEVFKKKLISQKKKCITVRNNSEWSEIIAGGSNVLSSPDNILNSFNDLKLNEFKFTENYYGSGNASEIIIKSIFDFLS